MVIDKHGKVKKESPKGKDKERKEKEVRPPPRPRETGESSRWSRGVQEIQAPQESQELQSRWSTDS